MSHANVAECACFKRILLFLGHVANLVRLKLIHYSTRQVGTMKLNSAISVYVRIPILYQKSMDEHEMTGSAFK